MGALRQTRLSEDLRKPPETERKAVSTSLEKLRARTDYDAGTGWCALPFAAFVDLLKLSSGEVCMRFVLAVNVALASGSRSPKEAWDSWTEFRSTQEWADATASNVRDIQRQLVELKERGLIAVKQIKNGTVKYSVFLLYRKWGKLESYAAWKIRKVVAIDEDAAELAEDESAVEISKDAVHLTKKPQRIAPGRASRAVKVNVGVSSFRFQSTDSRVDLIHDAVIQSGCLIVSVTSPKGESEAKGEDKGKAGRHACRALPTNEGIQNTPTKEGSAFLHPRSKELVKLFDPILSASSAGLLSGDSASLKAACEAVADCDHEFLVKFAIQRAERPVKSPLHVPTICAEALASSKASKVLSGAGLPREEEGPRLSPKGKRVAEGLRRIYGDKIK
jgi:hypothetical protein